MSGVNNNSFNSSEMNNNETLSVNNGTSPKYFGKKGNLRSTQEISLNYRSIFSDYPCFNVIQSKVIDTVLYTDENLVVSAPTGSGKTVIFELAIVRLLSVLAECNYNGQFKIIYMSPTKALCEERLTDWHSKFGKLGLSCIVVTGDSDNVDYNLLTRYQLIITTPEKWDSLTRRWKDNKKLVEIVKLFLIDEVHLLNEENRGPTLEAVVSRMKTVQESLKYEAECEMPLKSLNIRFLAASATIPNVEDIAEWIGRPIKRARYYKFGEEMRPVKLNRIVLGYSTTANTMNPFKFELMLNYKLAAVIRQYSEGKPTLVFCSTRKGTEMTCDTLKQDLTFNFTPMEKTRLIEATTKMSTPKIREILQHGIGYHHAGLPLEDRRGLEEVFRNGYLPVLITTSTLASGVNLPAHLVIIKSTKQYDGPKNGYVDIPETAVLQMIGRAGRPQFDKTATAVIMTNHKDKDKYERMVGGQHPVESNLHRHLVEHLNAEVVLHTITDLEVAVRWLSSTFLHVRAQKNPSHYNLPKNNPTLLERKLLEVCQIEINRLAKSGMLILDPRDGINISPTPVGNLMAKYYLQYPTMKLFLELKGTETLDQLLSLVSKSSEYMDNFLRVSDKKVLNDLNKCKTKETVRFPIKGKISALDMKIYCLTQAVFGCLTISNPSLLQESQKVVRVGERISKCLAEYLEMRGTCCFSALLNANILAKCFSTGLWENSRFISKQLNGIGNVLSTALASAGKFTFDDILDSNPRDLERIIRKNAPLGTTIQEEISKLPKYKLELCLFDLTPPFIAHLTVTLLNLENVKRDSVINVHSNMILLVGDSLNNILVNEKITHLKMIQNPQMTKVINLISDSSDQKLVAHFISENWAGIDTKTSFNLSKDDESGKPNCQESHPSDTNTAGKESASKQTSNNKNTTNAKETNQIKKQKSSAHIQQFITKHFKSTKSTSFASKAPIASENQTLRKDDEKAIPKQDHLENLNDTSPFASLKCELETVNYRKPLEEVLSNNVILKHNSTTDNKLLQNFTKDSRSEPEKTYNHLRKSTNPLAVHPINIPSHSTKAQEDVPSTPTRKINLTDFSMTPRKILTNDEQDSSNPQYSNSASTLTGSSKTGLVSQNNNSNLSRHCIATKTNEFNNLANNCNGNKSKNLSWRSPVVLPTPENLYSPNLNKEENVSSSIEDRKETSFSKRTCSAAQGRLISPYFRTSVGNLNAFSQRKTPLPTIQHNNIKIFPLSDSYFEDSHISSVTQPQPTVVDLTDYLSRQNVQHSGKKVQKNSLNNTLSSLGTVESSLDETVILVPKIKEEPEQNTSFEQEKEKVFQLNLQRFEEATANKAQKRSVENQMRNNNLGQNVKKTEDEDQFLQWQKRLKINETSDSKHFYADSNDERSNSVVEPFKSFTQIENLYQTQKAIEERISNKFENHSDLGNDVKVSSTVNIFEDGNFDFNMEDNWKMFTQSRQSYPFPGERVRDFPLENPDFQYFAHHHQPYANVMSSNRCVPSSVHEFSHNVAHDNYPVDGNYNHKIRYENQFFQEPVQSNFIQNFHKGDSGSNSVYSPFVSPVEATYYRQDLPKMYYPQQNLEYASATNAHMQNCGYPDRSSFSRSSHRIPPSNFQPNQPYPKVADKIYNTNQSICSNNYMPAAPTYTSQLNANAPLVHFNPRYQSRPVESAAFFPPNASSFAENETISLKSSASKQNYYSQAYANYAQPRYALHAAGNPMGTYRADRVQQESYQPNAYFHNGYRLPSDNNCGTDDVLSCNNSSRCDSAAPFTDKKYIMEKFLHSQHEAEDLNKENAYFGP